MASSKGRTGAGIREFLEYYLLVLFNEGTATKQKMVELILERSSDNNQYRPGSALLVADQEVDSAISLLLQKNCIKTTEKGDAFEITGEGRRRLEEVDKIKEQTSGSKEEATQKLISLLSPSPPKKYVLDVGTGEGYLAFKLAEAGFKVLGIDSSDLDYSKDSIQEAIGKIGGKNNIEFRVTDVKKLTGFQDAFDYVVSSQAVHCMKNREGCMEAIIRLLKEGGKFVCSDFSVGLLGFLHHGFHCFLALSKEEWLKMPPECGYVNVNVHEVNDFCVVEGQKARYGEE